jgi:hypothetical protein
LIWTLQSGKLSVSNQDSACLYFAHILETDYLWGSFTIFFGIVFFFVIPNDQASAFFLNKREKYVAVERLRTNQAVVENPHFQWYQAREALTDPRCLLMIPLAFLNVIPNACVSTFSPIVLKGMGYTSLQTIIMVSFTDKFRQTGRLAKSLIC